MLQFHWDQEWNGFVFFQIDESKVVVHKDCQLASKQEIVELFCSKNDSYTLLMKLGVVYFQVLRSLK